MKRNDGIAMFLVLLALCCFVAHADSKIELKQHEIWWGKNFKDPLWLGGIQMASRARMRDHVVKKGYQSILDIPCAYCIEYDGFMANGIAIDYQGMDITLSMIESCQERGIKAIQGSIEDVPLDDSSVDVTYSRHILEHLDYYEKSIRQLVRVARKESIIVFFIKPEPAPDHIKPEIFNNDMLYHNRYDLRKLEGFITSLSKVDSFEWEHVDSAEVILHIYLKAAQAEPTGEVDFDTSLGKNAILAVDGVSYRLFYDLLSDAPQFSKQWDLGVKPHTPTQAYTSFKNLYYKNAPWKIEKATHYHIPPTIHQIWIQGDLPENYKEWQASWQRIPGWNYKLWTDKEIRELPLQNRELYEKAQNYGEKSDIARYEILNLYGGIYVDIDFECLNPSLFEVYNHCYTFYTGLCPLDVAYLTCGNCLIASAANHPILKTIIQMLANNYDNSQPIWVKSGPAAFTKAVLESIDKPGYRDIVLPPSYLYPVGMYDVIGGSSTTARHYAHLLKPETAALHYWGRSWSDFPRY